MKVTIIGASFTNGNLGVVALAAGTVSAILERTPEAEISLLNYARQAEAHDFHWRGRTIQIPTVRLRWKPVPANNVIVLLVLAVIFRLLPSRLLKHGLASKNTVLRHIESCDVVVSIGGGDSFSDTYGMRVLVNVCLSQALVLLLGKRLLQFPQTIGPFTSRAARRIASLILGRSEVIFSRDMESIEELRILPNGSVLAGRARFCHDVGFLVEPQTPKNVQVDGFSVLGRDGLPLVGLNISGLLFAGGPKRDDAFKCQQAYVELTHRTIEHFLRDRNARVLLVPHVHGSGTDSDTEICSAIYKAAAKEYPGHVGLTLGRYSTAEIKSIIGQCDLFIGARMHACIGALSMGVPAVGVAYSRKFKGVYESLGIPELVIDPRTMGVDAMILSLAASFDRRGKIATNLAERIPEVKRSIVERIGSVVTLGPLRAQRRLRL